MKTINEIAEGYGVHPVQVEQWNKAIQDQAKTVFEGKRGPKAMAEHREPELLYSEIGKLKVELDWLNTSPASACPDAASMDRQREHNGRLFRELCTGFHQSFYLQTYRATIWSRSWSLIQRLCRETVPDVD